MLYKDKNENENENTDENLKNLKKSLMTYQHKRLIRDREIIQRFKNKKNKKNKKNNHLMIMIKNKIFEHKKLTNFASNDYLNISQDARVKKAFIKGVSLYGLGSGSSPLVSGFYQSQLSLEEKFAHFLNRDKAVLFNSGYHANLGIITTLASRKSAIIADKLSHASIIDGILLSRAKYYRYQHNQLDHLECLLKKVCLNNSNNLNNLIITESVFSMEGDISPINKISALAKKYQTNLMIDDAHGFGLLGKNGSGITEYYHLSQQDIPFLVIPLGKAVGSMGAIVAGPKDFIDALIQFARSYIYSTALPPAIAFATQTCLKIIQTENWRREKLISLIQFFIDQANLRNLTLVSTDLTPIKSMLIGDNQKAVAVKNTLMQKGFLTACIRPPSVPKNTARIKICLNIGHTESDIIQLLDLLADSHASF